MFTVEIALVIDFLRRACWRIVTCVLAILAIYALMAKLSAPAKIDPALVLVIHFTELLLMGGIVLPLLFDFNPNCQGFPRRLLALPLSTPRLVAGWMLSGMIPLILISLSMSCVLGLTSDVQVPIWWPTVFYLATLTSVMALMSVLITPRGGPGILLVLVYLFYLGRWFFKLSPYPAVQFALEPIVIAGLIALFPASYLLALWGVARARRGEAWIDLIADALQRRLPRFGHSRLHACGSGQQAQDWFEVRTKGIFLPFLIGFVGLILAGMRAFGKMQNSEMLPTLLIVGWMLMTWVPIILGLRIGQLGASMERPELGTLLGSRPLTNNQLARSVRKALLVNLAGGYALWMLFFLIAVAGLYAVGERELFVSQFRRFIKEVVLNDSASENSWMHIVMQPLFAWTVFCISASLTLTGRVWVAGLALAVIFLLSLGSGLAATYLDWHYNPIIVGMAALTGAYCLTLNRQTVRAIQLLPALCLWIAAWMLLSSQRLLELLPNTLDCVLFVICVAALLYLPWRIMPQAIAWNRHR